ncbi:MAG: hypothetical protein WAV47_13375 [Blastocatellia bacterium]
MQNLADGGPSESLVSARRGTRALLGSLPLIAVVMCSVVYAAHFFLGGGRNHLILDSFAYLQLTQHQQASVPFNTRISTPFLAALIGSVTGLSTSAAFQLLTSAALLASLLLLRGIIRRRKGSPEWQGALLLAFGCSLAVTFGYTPVVVDPSLLLLTCLTIAALDTGHLPVALALACIATMTKEYGLLLGVVWSLHAYRQGLRKLACLGLVLPATALVILLVTRQSGLGIGFGSWPKFSSHLMLEYQWSVFRLRGPVAYAELIYMWSWCALWPTLFISISSLISRFRRREKMTGDELAFAVLLTALPILLLGDWSRNLIIMVPFACIVVTSHPLAKERYFVSLVAIGGLATALARPFHSEPSPSQTITLIMTIISVVSSLLAGVRLLRFASSKSSPQIETLNRPSPEAALP